MYILFYSDYMDRGESALLGIFTSIENINNYTKKEFPSIQFENLHVRHQSILTRHINKTTSFLTVIYLEPDKDVDMNIP